MTTGTSQTVSTEAHQRMTTDRDEALARVAELESKLGDATQVTQAALARAKYLEYRAAADPTLAPIVAELDIATPMLNSVDPEQLEAQVAQVAERLTAFRGPGVTPPPTPDPETPPQEPAAPPNTQVPGFPQPNPGAEGQGGKVEELDIQGKADLIAKEGMAGARAALESGQITLSEEVRDRHGL